MFTRCLFLLSLISCIYHRVGSASTDVDPDENHPIIIIPGLLGSAMESKRDTKPNWSRIWYNGNVINPRLVDRWVEKFKREFTDFNDSKTKNPYAISTRVIGWGSTEGIEDLSSYSGGKDSPAQNATPAGWISGKTAYFKNMVTRLVKEMQYIRNESIRGAPYDFRRAPYDNLDYFEELSTLIEETYTANGNKTVIIISHSMGCLQFLYLLQSKSQTWKDQYIRGWIPIAGPFGGSVKMLSALTKGEALVMDQYQGKMKTLMRTFSSSYFLLPDERIFGDQIVWTRKYKKEGNGQPSHLTAKDMRHILFDIYNLKDEIKMFDAASVDLNGNIYDQHPGVNTHCVYSDGISTPVEVISEEEKHSLKSTKDGDGSTLFLSGKLCQKWVDSDSSTKDSFKEYHNIEHMALVKNDKAVDHVISIVKKLNGCGVNHPPLDEKHMSTAEIASIAVGSSAGLFCLGGAVFYIWRVFKRKTTSN